MTGIAFAAVAVAAKADLRLVDLGGAWGVEGVAPQKTPLPGAPYNGPEVQVYKNNRIGDYRWVDDDSGAVVPVFHIGGYTEETLDRVVQEFTYLFGSGRRFRYEEKGTTYCVLVSQVYSTAGGGTGRYDYQNTCEQLSPTPKPVSCEMVQNVNIEMGSVQKSEFKGDGFPGGPQVETAVPFTCSGPTEIKVSVTGEADPNIIGGLLKLTKGGATGIAVLLRVNGQQAVVNGSGITVDGAEGANVFQLSAQYYQSQTSVSAGAANASATVNVQVP